jgi:hypothetical protein
MGIFNKIHLSDILLKKDTKQLKYSNEALLLARTMMFSEMLG